MKNIGIVILILLASFAMVWADVDYSAESTLLELSANTNIPVKKYIQYLELPADTDLHTSLAELKIGAKDLEKAQKAYDENLIPFYTGVVIVGMSIVFVSLMLTGLIISQLKNLGNKPKKKVKKASVKTSGGTVTGPADHLSNNAVVAAITAIYLHEMDVEEQNKMLLTWKRAPLSMWKASNIMPNNEYFQAKRNR